MTRVRNPEFVARLTEERDLLLSQLDRLDDELAVGALDKADHSTLADDLTRRTAQVIKRLNRQRPAIVTRHRSSTRRRWISVAAIAIVAVFGGVAVAAFSGVRLSGQLGSGEIAQSSRDLLIEARAEFGAGDVAAARATLEEIFIVLPGDADALVLQGQIGEAQGELLEAVQAYDAALMSEPEHVDALAFKGWILVRLPGEAQQQDGIALLDSAIATGEAGFEPYLFRALSADRIEGDLAGAIEFYREVLARNPPEPMVAVVEGNIAELEAELAAI